MRAERVHARASTKDARPLLPSAVERLESSRLPPTLPSSSAACIASSSGASGSLQRHSLIRSHTCARTPTCPCTSNAHVCNCARCMETRVHLHQRINCAHARPSTRTRIAHPWLPPRRRSQRDTCRSNPSSRPAPSSALQGGGGEGARAVLGESSGTRDGALREVVCSAIAQHHAASAHPPRCGRLAMPVCVYPAQDPGWEHAPLTLDSTIFQCSAVASLEVKVVASFFAMARLLGSARARASPLALQWRRATSTTCQGADPHPRILHAAPDWLVIDKPAGWHSVRPGGARQRRGTQGAGAPLAGDAPAGAAADDALGAQRCVQDWLAETVPGQQRLDEAGLCNRLDLVTSGCMLAAKTAESLELLRAGVRSGDGVAKHYLALICGTLQPQEGSFSLYFSGRYRRSKKVSVSPHRPAAGDRHHGDPCCLPSPVSPFLLLSRARILSLCMSNTPLVLSCPEQEPADGAYWVRGPSLSPRPTCSE